MATEIERKFLVNGESWRVGAEGLAYRQGYLNRDPERTVRVRLAGDAGFLTVKGRSQGACRTEFEYPIPVADARAMLEALCLGPIIEKVRYRVPFGGHVWEVDEFGGENRGLVLAELELGAPDEDFAVPPWVGQEVTGDPRYYNANLAQHPYRRW